MTRSALGPTGSGVSQSLLRPSGRGVCRPIPIVSKAIRRDVARFCDLPFHPFNDRIRFEFNRALGIDISDDVTRIGLAELRMEHSRGEVWRLDESGKPDSIDPDATSSPESAGGVGMTAVERKAGGNRGG